MFVLCIQRCQPTSGQDWLDPERTWPQIQLVQFDRQLPIDPTQRRDNSTAPGAQNGQAGRNGSGFQPIEPHQLFGTVNQVEQLSEHRRKLAHSPAADAVFGVESRARVSNDIGDLLRKSISSHGVSTQDRTPIVNDTRVRGQRAGQVLASGSYWTPVRSDLDTMMNKIDSRLVEDVIVIKVRTAPGTVGISLRGF
ncbi:MAG: hypothetical protein R3C49_17020 [Planctomycetaceae bacterium]